MKRTLASIVSFGAIAFLVSAQSLPQTTSELLANWQASITKVKSTPYKLSGTTVIQSNISKKALRCSWKSQVSQPNIFVAYTLGDIERQLSYDGSSWQGRTVENGHCSGFDLKNPVTLYDDNPSDHLRSAAAGLFFPFSEDVIGNPFNLGSSQTVFEAFSEDAPSLRMSKVDANMVELINSSEAAKAGKHPMVVRLKQFGNNLYPMMVQGKMPTSNSQELTWSVYLSDYSALDSAYLPRTVSSVTTDDANGKELLSATTNLQFSRLTGSGNFRLDLPPEACSVFTDKAGKPRVLPSSPSKDSYVWGTSALATVLLVGLALGHRKQKTAGSLRDE